MTANFGPPPGPTTFTPPNRPFNLVPPPGEYWAAQGRVRCCYEDFGPWCAFCDSMSTGHTDIGSLRVWWFMPCRNCGSERLVHDTRHPHLATETVMHGACWGFVPFSAEEMRQEILDIKNALENE